jgi:MinD superfamily P-loop ATPase
MKQLLILSGKGGTGKTTLASAFIKFANARAYADCDVDAPNLHLVSSQSTEPKRTDYYGLPKAEIDQGKCIKCDLCRQKCHFGAITTDKGYKVDYFACEGCSVCEAVCPVNAVTMNPAVAGELMLYADKERVFSTAQLKMGSGNSGKLVSEVKKQLSESAPEKDFAIIDGSPGIGCPVIASLSGVDMVLIVTEPSLSGISDMERIIKTADIFNLKLAVCINKYDTSLENSEKIKAFCQERKISFVGKIPFDPYAGKAINEGVTIAEIDCPSGKAASEVFNKTMKLLFGEGSGYRYDDKDFN